MQHVTPSDMRSSFLQAALALLINKESVIVREAEHARYGPEHSTVHRAVRRRNCCMTPCQ